MICDHAGACDEIPSCNPAGTAQSELSRGIVIRTDHRFRGSPIPNEGSPQERARVRPAHGRPGVSGILRTCRGASVDAETSDGERYHLSGPILSILRKAGLKVNRLRGPARFVILVGGHP